jgi:hypothetical protein
LTFTDTSHTLDAGRTSERPERALKHNVVEHESPLDHALAADKPTSEVRR